LLKEAILAPSDKINLIKSLLDQLHVTRSTPTFQFRAKGFWRELITCLHDEMSGIDTESAAMSAKYAESDPKELDKNGTVVPRTDSDDALSIAEPEEAQAGVKRIEAVSESWTKWGLVVAYVSYETNKLRKGTTPVAHELIQVAPDCKLHFSGGPNNIHPATIRNKRIPRALSPLHCDRRPRRHQLSVPFPLRQHDIADLF
jgi:hypothetical protein